MAEEVNTTQVPDSKERLTSRYKESRPDLNWDGSVDNDVFGLAADELSKYDEDRKKRQEVDEKMNTLFKSNPRASRIFVDWSKGKDPIENLVEMYGDDFVAALQSPEGKDKFKQALEKWRKGKDAEEAHQKAYDENINNTARVLIEFADKNNLTDEQMKGIIEQAYAFASDAMEGKYSPEFLTVVMKAGNFDRAVEDARNEGRIDGRNEKIEAKLRQSKNPTGMPNTAGGQDVSTTQQKQKKANTGSLPMFGGIPIKRES